MDFHRGPHAQAALEAAEVVIGDVLLDHLDQLLPAGEPPAIVAVSYTHLDVYKRQAMERMPCWSRTAVTRRIVCAANCL